MNEIYKTMLLKLHSISKWVIILLIGLLAIISFGSLIISFMGGMMLILLPLLITIIWHIRNKEKQLYYSKIWMNFLYIVIIPVIFILSEFNSASTKAQENEQKELTAKRELYVHQHPDNTCNELKNKDVIDSHKGLEAIHPAKIAGRWLANIALKQRNFDTCIDDLIKQESN